MDDVQKVSHCTDTFNNKRKCVSVYRVRKCDVNCIIFNKVKFSPLQALEALRVVRG
jgi:hypothetical protein